MTMICVVNDVYMSLNVFSLSVYGIYREVRIGPSNPLGEPELFRSVLGLLSKTLFVKVRVF